MRKTEKKSIAVIDDEVQMLKVIGRYVTEAALLQGIRYWMRCGEQNI